MTIDPDYFTARTRFRDTAKRIGWTLRTYPINARGPHGEELTIDVALSSPAGDQPVLLTTSAVHGVEGFMGSAIQIEALNTWLKANAWDNKLRCVMVHAVSPYGFAHIRRFNEDSVDQNRNFLLEGESFTGSPPAYAAVDHLLNPPRPPSAWALFHLRAFRAMLTYGYQGLKQAIAGGQYDFPKGVFFGGHGPTLSFQILRDQMPIWFSDAPRIVHLDFHSGLGRWATYKLLVEDAFPEEEVERVNRWFGPGVYEPSEPRGVAYHTRGGFGRWCPTLLPDRDYLFLCAEFGTYPSLTVASGVVDENRAHHWCEPNDPIRIFAKKRLLELFCPASVKWRHRVIKQGCRIIEQAVSGLQSESAK